MHFQKVAPHSSHQQQKTVSRKSREFVLAATASTLPVVGIAFTLIFIVQHYYLPPSQVPIEDLRTNSSNHAPSFYYVDFSATRLTTVASWASTIALVLPSSVMSVYWHHLASSMQENVRKCNSEAMPTPYEYSLLLALRTGGLPPLWEWIQYRFLRRRQRGNTLLSDAGRILISVLFLG